MPNTKKVTVDQLSTVANAIAEKSDTRFQQKEAGKGLSANDFTDNLKNKLDGVAEGANNYTLPDATTEVKGGVMLSSATDSTDANKAATPAAVKAAYDLANGKQSPATTVAGYGITDAYTKTEVDNAVGAKADAATTYTKTEVDNAIAAAASSSYHAGGTLAPAAILPALLVAANDSKVYNISGEFTTDANFVEGAGKTHPAGTNIVVVNTGTDETPDYKFDVLAGFVDLANYATLDDVEVATAQDIQDIVDGIYDDGE